MSAPRFASITASLLARKGEARPWEEPAKQALAWERGELPPPVAVAVPVFVPAPVVAHAAETGFFKPSLKPPLAAEPQPAAELAPASEHVPLRAGDWKKISVRMTHHDYERLGILAIKQDKTRQRVLQEAVDRLLRGITVKFGSSCACLGPEKTTP